MFFHYVCGDIDRLTLHELHKLSFYKELLSICRALLVVEDC